MAGAAITFDDAAVQEALDRVGAAGGDTSAMMADITAAMLLSTHRRFETESDPDGKAWAPLKPRTAAQRARGRGNAPANPKILRDTNRLYSSITGQSDDTTSQVGTNVVYAGIHQTGGTITQYPQSRTIRMRKVGRKRLFAKRTHKRVTEHRATFGTRTIVIPARPYLGFSDEDRAELLAIGEAHLVRAIGGAE